MPDSFFAATGQISIDVHTAFNYTFFYHLYYTKVQFILFETQMHFLFCNAEWKTTLGPYGLL